MDIYQVSQEFRTSYGADWECDDKGIVTQPLHHLA